jgi:hypothetical protein
MGSLNEWESGVADALEALRKMEDWRLTAPRWELIGEVLDELAEAYATGDPGDLLAAVADLQPTSPVRATRLGSAVVTGAPGPVLDRRNVLIHALTTKRR